MICARSLTTQPILDVYAPIGEAVYFVQQHIGIDDYAVADDIHRLGPEHAAGDDVEAELAVFVDDGVAGVVATGETSPTMSASRASTSMIFPFPSSPH